MKNSQIMAMSFLLLACGVETKPNPHFDAGGTGGSGGSGATSGSGGSSGTGGTSGSGGSAGTGGVGGDLDAGEDSGMDADAGDAMTSPCSVTCSGDTPHCHESSMTCVACLNSDHCESNSNGTVCDNGACVECTQDDGCTLPSVCQDDGHQCVECNETVDCGDDEVCKLNGHACVECNSQEDCDNGEKCSPENTCEQCVDDANCSTAGAARCDTTTYQCVPCTENANCDGVVDGSTQLGVCNSGTCVECTADDYDQCGNGNLGQPRVCNAITSRCGTTMQTEGSSGLCQECVSNAHCDPGQACVGQVFEDHNVGNFCFWRIAAPQGPNGDCLSVRPYVRGLTNQVTVEGDNANVCGLRSTTCEGIGDFSNPNVACAPGNTADHDLCGFSYDGEGTPGKDRDAYCEQVPASPSYRCTVPCGSADDCKPGFDCVSGPNGDVCEL